MNPMPFRTLLSSLSVALVALPTLGQPSPTTRPVPAATPSPRNDPNSKIAHEQLVKKAQSGRIDTYFLGDSITRRWGSTDPQWAENFANWKKNFHGWNAGNFGWGADSTQNILWRIRNGELDGVNPKVIVILAGTNNIGSRPGPASKVPDTIAGLRAILDTCREKAPNAKIILMGITPRNDNIAVMPEINAVNQGLAAMADQKHVYYLDINHHLASPDGKLFDGMTIDNLHLSTKAYQIWADALKPLLTEFLGPPADVDLAPPPTGDPSIAPPARP